MRLLRPAVPVCLAAAVLLLIVSRLGGAGADDGGFVTFVYDGQPRDTSGPVTPWETPGVTAQNQIGTDGRVQVTDTLAHPYRSIAWIGLWYDGASGEPDRNFSCTAAFIGPDVLLTAAHCLYGADIGGVDEITVIPAANQPDEPFGEVTAQAWSVPQAFIDDTTDHRFDYAVISLPGASPVGEETGWLPLAVLETGTLAGVSFMPMVAGYPGDRQPRTMWRHSQPALAEVAESFLGYEIDSANGMSGSPVFSSNGTHTQFRRVVGVHVLGGGGTAPNQATRATAAMASLVTAHCAQWDCEPSIVDESDPPAPTATTTGTVTATKTPANRVVVPQAARSGQGAETAVPSATPAVVPGVVDRLWEWFALIDAYGEEVSSVSAGVLGGGSPAGGAAGMQGIEDAAHALAATAGEETVVGGPVCDAAQGWIVEASGRAATWAGAWAAVFENWPGVAYYAAVDEAFDAYFVGLDETETWIEGCDAALGG